MRDAAVAAAAATALHMSRRGLWTMHTAGNARLSQKPASEPLVARSSRHALVADRAHPMAH